MKTETVTSLENESARILSELKKTRMPVLITENGRPTAYLVDVDQYEKLVAETEILEGLACGERAFRDKRVFSHDEAKAKLAGWLN